MPVKLEVKLDPKERASILRAVIAVEQETLKMIEVGKGLEWLAKDYLKELRIAIVSQKYAHSYARYNAKYEEWKRSRYGSSEGFWRLSGDLLRALTVYNPANGVVMAGVPMDSKDAGGKNYKMNGPAKSIAMYGSVMEEGLRSKSAGKHPARPVFEPVFRSFTSSKSSTQQGGMWSGGERILLRIGEFWRPS